MINNNMVVMMFGFGNGKMNIIIPKTNYAPGEEIQGTVNMDLKKTVNARGVIFRLFAIEHVSEYHGGRRSSRDVTLFSTEIPLDTEKEYPARSTYTYQFKVQVPRETVGKEPDQVTGGIMKAVNILSGRSSRISWYLEAKLDIPNSLDVNKKIQISVSSPESGPLVN